MAKLVCPLVAVYTCREAVPFTADPAATQDVPFHTRISLAVVSKYNAPVTSALPSLSTLGGELFAPRYLSSNWSHAASALLADVDAAAQDSALFNAAERATLALAIAMTRDVQVSDACFSQIQVALPSPQSQVELAGVIAAYNMVSRFLEALQVAPE